MEEKSLLVSHRIEQLADRAEGFDQKKANDLKSGSTSGSHLSMRGCFFRSKKVQKEYEQMLRMIGSEFEILRTVPLEKSGKSPISSQRGIERLRNGEVERISGFDGEYGKFKPRRMNWKRSIPDKR